ncbi:MarR family transcriptional regulator [Aeromicrobium sp.]|uniref:MarR family winged helix-turn-helix transcriptional regulator n=1 Tax=Aeromicrobium sp. TaxID=1871063 RepID=UPI0019B7F525|nr:MarR family transcriptional regulator [Aeromicrobium sp.]MBC7632151.1 MarR family transcriptional regulator [Aeromicrobium sp.]
MGPSLQPRQVDDLRLAVIRLERKLRKSTGSGGGGVTPSQYSALFTLDRHGPFRLGELARREQISKSTVTRLVAGLEARAFVVRTEDDSDARSSIIGISGGGRTLLADLAWESNDYLRLRMESLGEADLALLLGAIGILIRLADRA